jgi:hypothetical protein
VDTEIDSATSGRLSQLGQGELEVAKMANDDRDILELLKDELDFIEKADTVVRSTLRGSQSLSSKSP